MHISSSEEYINKNMEMYIHLKTIVFDFQGKQKLRSKN